MLLRTVVALAAVVVLTGCGRTVTTAASPAAPAPPASPTVATSTAPTGALPSGTATGAVPTSGATTDPGGATDPGAATCNGLTTEDVARFGVMAQLFPQLGNAGALKAVRDGVVAYDPKTFAETLAKMEFLRGQQAPFGDPGASLDYYYAVNDALAALLAKPEPTQADFDAYLAVVGDVASSITQQGGITSLLGELCPDLI